MVFFLCLIEKLVSLPNPCKICGILGPASFLTYKKKKKSFSSLRTKFKHIWDYWLDEKPKKNSNRARASWQKNKKKPKRMSAEWQWNYNWNLGLHWRRQGLIKGVWNEANCYSTCFVLISCLQVVSTQSWALETSGHIFFIFLVY